MPPDSNGSCPVEITATLVQSLVAAQFPLWAKLPIRAVEPGRPSRSDNPPADAPEWWVYRWLEGEPVGAAASIDEAVLARDLAAFLRALQAIGATDGPAPGPHNVFRGGSPLTYDQDTKRALADLASAPRVLDTVLGD